MTPPALLSVLLVVALLPAHASAHLNDTIYMVTISSRATAGVQEPLCVHVLGPSEPLSLSVTLEVNKEKTPLLEESVSQDFHRCLTFQAPVVSRNTPATVELRVAGEQDSMMKQSRILILPPAFIHLVQTDKPIYKPGQTVKFRIVSMDTAFVPVSRLYQDVAITDPNSNRIAQWLDKAVDAAGILDLSHPVIPEAVQGTYTVTATTDKGEKISHTFEIKEYVLPKYEVKVQLPTVISILDKEATFSVCGKYTYGKPVIGSVKAEFCRSGAGFYWYSHSRVTDICRNYELQTDKSGCVRQTVSLADFALNNDMYADTFTVTAEMEEYGTGVLLKGSGRSSFTSDIQTVTFEDVPASYKPGIPFEGKVRVVGPDSKAVAEQPVYLSAGPEQKVNLVTDAKGLASFSLDTSAWKSTVHLRAKSRNSTGSNQYVPHLRRPEYREAHHNVEEFYSKSRSFLKLKQISRRFSCDEDAAVQAQYIVQGNELKAGQEVLDVFYLVLSKGTIVQHGRVPVSVTAGSVNSGELSFPLTQVMRLAPVAQVVVYTVMPGGEGVADSQNFPIQMCLNNKVSLKFSSLQELPAEKTTVSLQARPGSLCSLRAVDQSVLLLKKEQELTVDHVFNQLPIQSVSGFPSEVSDFEPYPCWPFAVPLQPNGRAKRSIMSFEPAGRKHDVFSVFEEVGVKLITNSDVKKPSECFRFGLYDAVDSPLMPMANMMPQGTGSVLRRKEDEKKETVRTFFPETWIWDLVAVGDDGAVSLERTVPDTITKWAASAFCVSSEGFGVAPNVGLTVFQPFFVSLTLPYSVVRGEVFTLKATVFNYLSKCIMVDVTLAASDQFTFRNCDGCLYAICLCAEESRTFSWIVTPTALGKVDVKVSAEALKTDSLCGNEVATVPDVGRVDTVIRNLLVEAEGTPQMVSHNALLCPADGPVEKEISLLLPELFVAGSARASVSVVGDLMGRAMKNLDKLLAMPYGCGEQNMLLFAPNIFILNYLQSTQQLTKTILDKAVRFLQSGYQRELTYQHSDGSYSAFGKGDASGNTWLTAFVMKSFGGATPFIFIDQKHIDKARAWLSGHQRPDGCIQSVGKLFHNELKGGVNDDVTLTAYITAAFLELDSNATNPVVQNCLRCLKAAAAAAGADDVYTSALLAYTFTLAGDQDLRSKLVSLLHHKSTLEASGGRHWERSGASRKKLDSLEVEITSYVLLALLSGPPMADFGLGYSTGIVRWLTQQQNPFGGFSSTQDTVVALQALAKYGAATYSPDGTTTVTVTSLGGLNKEFTVSQENRLLYQEERLDQIPGEYRIQAQGQSCVLAQISGHYNVPPPADFSAFNISVSSVPKCAPSRSQLDLQVSVRYQGRREETNMVIINVKLLSGYVVDKAALARLQSDRTVKRVDIEEGYINIYLDGLKKDETMTYPLSLEEDQPVRNLKPAVVKVYDYYQTSDEAATEYTTTCAESDNVNEL